jgi:membrane protein implicated in regulation of membrane protease activity
MNLDFQFSFAIVLFAIGAVLNIMANQDWIRSRKAQFFGQAATFIGLGLFVPFSWLYYVGLPWWSGIVGVCVLGIVLKTLLNMVSERRKVLKRQQRSR